MLSPGPPAPASVAEAVPPGVALTVKEADLEPALVGVKRTTTVQLALGASVPLQPLLTVVN